MARELRVTLETGPKAKRVVAVAPDWPGLERGARTSEAAIEALRSYLPRYGEVAKLAGMEAEFAAATRLKVVERYPGTGSTDFWGISFAFSTLDLRPMTDGDLERELALLRAGWTFFDQVRARVSRDMQKGPRGGGRDRDRIVHHVLATEQKMFAKKVGWRPGEADVLTEDGDLQHFRDFYCQAIRSVHAEGKSARSWPLRYLLRHTAYHTLDHAWEMEDKDLTGSAL